MRRFTRTTAAVAAMVAAGLMAGAATTASAETILVNMKGPGAGWSS